MALAKRSALRTRVRFWYTIALFFITMLVALFGAHLVGAAPTRNTKEAFRPAQYQATAIPLPAISSQRIQIDSPVIDTLVGSPMTITGWVHVMPKRNLLGYRVVHENGESLGGGTFSVNGVPGAPIPFVASVNYRLPPNGGIIRLDLFDHDYRTEAPVATTSVLLYVARPQAINIESLIPGSASDGIVTVVGRADRLPHGAQLFYTVSASDGRLLGEGQAPVPGSEGRVAFFEVNVKFNPPPEGDNVTVVVYDKDPSSGAAIASASLPLNVAPQPQRILVDTPAADTRVGSPMTVTGRTVRLPGQGVLSYTIADSRGNLVGSGIFPVPGSRETGGSFVVTLGFAHPPLGGPLQITLYDKADDGSLRATATVNVIAAPLITPTPVVPTATPTPQSFGAPSPVALIASFYDAINRRDYSKAYGYWIAPDSYEVFRRGYENTSSVQVFVEPPVWVTDLWGNLQAAAPTGIVAKQRDGSSRYFAGCYLVTATRPTQGQKPLWRLSHASVEETDSDQKLVEVMDEQCSNLGLPLPGGREGNDGGRGDQFALLGSYYSAIMQGNYQLAYNYWEVPPTDYESFARWHSSISRVRVFVRPLARLDASLIPTVLLLTDTMGDVEIAAGCSVVRQSLSDAGGRWSLSTSTVALTPFGPSVPALLADGCSPLR